MLRKLQACEYKNGDGDVIVNIITNRHHFVITCICSDESALQCTCIYIHIYSMCITTTPLLRSLSFCLHFRARFFKTLTKASRSLILLTVRQWSMSDYLPTSSPSSHKYCGFWKIGHRLCHKSPTQSSSGPGAPLIANIGKTSSSSNPARYPIIYFSTKSI